MAAAMSGHEAASFGRCIELLRAVGDPPELACARYAEAVGVLGCWLCCPKFVVWWKYW